MKIDQKDKQFQKENDIKQDDEQNDGNNNNNKGSNNPEANSTITLITVIGKLNTGSQPAVWMTWMKMISSHF